MGVGVGCRDGVFEISVTPAGDDAVEVSLIDEETGAVVDDNVYQAERVPADTVRGASEIAGVLLDVSGTESENVGRLAVKHYNGLNDLSVDFPRGSCDIIE